LKQPNHSFLYKVIKEGVYPSKLLLTCIRPPNKSQISDDYIVETTCAKGDNQ
ncbi:22008_t:CDS:1, partial [Gigaspora margarita]